VAHSDAEITGDIVEALSRDGRVNTARITVTVSQGHATLSGDAATLYAICVANHLAASVAGVLIVNNQLAVARPDNVPADADIKDRAVQILGWNTSIGTHKVRVSVTSGRVVLEGEVEAYWKRSRAESLILDIQGVVDVDNRLAVIPEIVPQDQVIATDIKSALARYQCPNQDRINVEVDHGLVTLSGHVPSWWSKQNMPHLAESILGVKGVVDHLVVEPASR